jgi:pyocin large subunit-like protein
VATPGQGTPAEPAVTHPEIGFRDPSHLAEHYQKHGAEFGGISESEYLVRAQTLRDRPTGGTIREAVRRDGVITRFDRGSGEFLAFDPDLTIRTFFRPNDGEAYFDRQLKRGQSRS